MDGAGERAERGRVIAEAARECLVAAARAVAIYIYIACLQMVVSVYSYVFTGFGVAAKVEAAGREPYLNHEALHACGVVH